MKIKKAGIALGVLTVGALALTGCAQDSGNGGNGGGSDVITTNGSEPQFPLVPANTTETGGGKIVTSIFAGLVTYNADGTISNDVAESIESDDNQLWTVTLKDDQKFSDGSAVTASSFVDAWNWAANPTNGNATIKFFDNIEGFVDGPAEEGAEATDNPAMSGLTVVDDTTFTVQLVAPETEWPLRLGYTAYSPLPESFYDDVDAFGENPIGNGPYMLAEEGAWQHDVRIDLVANPEYDGARAPENDGLSFVFYTTQDAAYADVQGGNLDVLDAVPDAQFGSYEDAFGDRSINQAAAIYQGFNIPYYLEHWSGEEGQLRRAAISMSIDREEITEVIFQGTRTPASDFTAPTIPGWTDSLDGAEVLEYDPEQAKELWAEAEAIAPYSGTVFDIAYNADGGHQAWVDAVANSISNTLGIEAVGKPYATFAEALSDRSSASLTGATRAGWQGDYPSLYNFLAPLYQTGAGNNYEQYSSPEFDALLEQGKVAATEEESVELFQSAQEVLLRDLPSVPLWYSNAVGVWAEGVDNVTFGWDSVPLYHEISKG